MGALNPKVAAWKREATEDPEGFWGRAAEALPWFRRWERVFEWEPPTFRWYLGGQTNLAYNCLDHHVAARRGRPRRADRRERARRAARLHLRPAAATRSKRVAAALRGLGHRQGRPRRHLHADLRRGDRADAGGGADRRDPLGRLRRLRRRRAGRADRAAGARAVFAADITYRKGKDVPLKGIVDDGGRGSGRARRAGRRAASAAPSAVPMTAGRDLTWDEFLALRRRPRRRPRRDGGQRARVHPRDVRHDRQAEARGAHPRRLPGLHPQHGAAGCSACEPTTSGGRPPTSAGSSATATSSTRRCWSAARRSPTRARSTTRTPRPSTGSSSENRVTGVFTSPTAVRLLMRYGARAGAQHDLCSLERVVLRRRGAQPAGLGVAPEGGLRGPHPGHRPHVADRDRRPDRRQPVRHRAAADQARLGAASRCRASRPRSSTPEGSELRAGREGHLRHQAALPRPDAARSGASRSATRSDYWERIPGRRSTSPATRRSIDEDGYVWFSGRADEIIKIAAHRIGTIEVETAFLRHPAVAEAGVTAGPTSCAAR